MDYITPWTHDKQRLRPREYINPPVIHGSSVFFVSVVFLVLGNPFTVVAVAYPRLAVSGPHVTCEAGHPDRVHTKPAQRSATAPHMDTNT